MARAASSFPTPLSPVRSTVALVGAARRMASHTFSRAGLWPTMRYLSSKLSLRRRFSSTRRFCPRALRATMRIRSLSGGFSMKSKAPSLTASTAALTVPWPERITTGGDGSSALRRLRTSRPSIWGILMSRMTRSGASWAAIFKPAGPLAARKTSYPS